MRQRHCFEHERMTVLTDYNLKVIKQRAQMCVWRCCYIVIVVVVVSKDRRVRSSLVLGNNNWPMHTHDVHRGRSFIQRTANNERYSFSAHKKIEIDSDFAMDKWECTGSMCIRVHDSVSSARCTARYSNTQKLSSPNE